MRWSDIGYNYDLLILYRFLPMTSKLGIRRTPIRLLFVRYV